MQLLDGLRLKRENGMNQVDDVCLNKYEWMDFMEEHEVFDVKSKASAKDDVFVILLEDEIGLFYKKDWEVIIYIWGRNVIAES